MCVDHLFEKKKKTESQIRASPFKVDNYSNIENMWERIGNIRVESSQKN